mmetsp:Transcript_3206/g.9270  ORF Transcript_3206/g.9270 Transcript_3206/m.9270 type:complete len:513 (+) Transcript_3206:3578-5116(+)
MRAILVTQGLDARARRPEQLHVGRRRHREHAVDVRDGGLVRANLGTVADHPLLERRRLAAEARDEGLALLRLAGDQARLVVVDDEEAHAAGRGAHRLDPLRHLRLGGVQHEAAPKAPHRRVGGQPPRRAQRVHLDGELLGPHRRRRQPRGELVGLLGILGAEGEEHRHLAEREAARGARRDAEHLARHRRVAEGVVDAAAEHLDLVLVKGGALVAELVERDGARVPRLVAPRPHVGRALLHGLVQAGRDAVQPRVEAGVRARAVAVHEGHAVGAHRRGGEEGARGRGVVLAHADRDADALGRVLELGRELGGGRHEAERQERRRARLGHHRLVEEQAELRVRAAGRRLDAGEGGLDGGDDLAGGGRAQRDELGRRRVEGQHVVRLVAGRHVGEQDVEGRAGRRRGDPRDGGAAEAARVLDPCARRGARVELRALPRRLHVLLRPRPARQLRQVAAVQAERRLDQRRGSARVADVPDVRLDGAHRDRPARRRARVRARHTLDLRVVDAPIAVR